MIYYIEKEFKRIYFVGSNDPAQITCGVFSLLLHKTRCMFMPDVYSLTGERYYIAVSNGFTHKLITH